MENIRLAPDDETDDLYSGFEVNEDLLNEIEEDEGLQKAIQTSYGQRPPVPRLRTRGRIATGMAPDVGVGPRPMSSVKGAGYNPLAAQGGVYGGGSTGKKVAPPLEAKLEDSPEDAIQQMEKKVNLLIEESAVASADGNYQLALDKAKEAGRKERLLCRQREQAGLGEQISLDLTYCVLFNLANQYQANHMYTEALNTYLLIVKNKMFNNGARLRINMGNIYFEQRKYPQAIKMYRMALDQIQNTHTLLRLKILQNIGAVFVRMGQYNDAISTYEHIMSEKPDFKTGLNMILCYCAMRDKEKLKLGFKRLLTIRAPVDDDERYMITDEEDPQQRLLVEIIRDDTLRKLEREEKETAERCILTAAKMMAPLIEDDFSVGFDWTIECVRGSIYIELASELEIAKAIAFLKQKKFQQAIETLKDIERKGSKMAGAAATNLSFIYFLEGDMVQAEKYADKAVEKDKYSPHALVNKGNTLFTVEQFEKAKEYYQEALSIESTCVEALFNLGLVHKRMSRIPEAVDCFMKLHTFLRSSPQVIFQIADCYDKMDDFNQATDWYMQLLSLVPTDPKVLQRMGEMFDSDNDKSQAYHYHSESFRYDPSSIEVISWLGAYFTETQFHDKAVHYFERAVDIQPNEINWQIMVASCHRKTGNYQKALETYRKIHERFPENLKCLNFLIRICTDLGLNQEAQEYTVKLKKAEKRELSAGERKSGGRSRRGSSNTLQTFHSGGRITSAGSGDGLSLESGGSSGPSSAKRREADPLYNDPLGELPERPKTSARPRQSEDVDFNDVELGEDLLPD